MEKVRKENQSGASEQAAEQLQYMLDCLSSEKMRKMQLSEVEKWFLEQLSEFRRILGSPDHTPEVNKNKKVKRKK